MLHITRDRTPSITRKIINVSNPVSVVEWKKQKAVRAVQPKLKRDGNENINESLEKDTIEITAYFETSIYNCTRKYTAIVSWAYVI